MKVFLREALLVALGLSFISCGSPTSSSSKRKPDGAINAGNREESLQALDESDVYCAVPGKECPNNVAKLTMRWVEDGEYRIGFCSATLIAEDLMITNRHCIPPGFHRNGADCEGAIMAKFPKTKTGPAEKVKCLEVVQVFEEEADQPDMAVIRVQKPIGRRDAVAIRKNRIRHGETLTAYTMDPGSRLMGAIRKKTCKVSQDDVFYYKQNRFAGNMIITGENCNVIGGNSGSSIRNSRGEIVGLIHSRLNASALQTGLRNSRIDTEFLDYAGVIVNMGCMGNIRRPGRKNCEIYQQTKSDLQEYLTQKVYDYNLNGFSESELDFKVLADLNVKVSKRSSRSGLSRALGEVRNTLARLFFGSDNSAQMAKYVQTSKAHKNTK